MTEIEAHTQAITVETRLQKGFSSHVDDTLSEYAKLFSRLSRCYFSEWSKTGFSSKNADKPSKKVFMKTYEISSRQFNAIRVNIEGMVDSQKRNLTRYLNEAEQKIAALERVITKKKALINKHKANGRYDLYAKQLLALQGKAKRLARLMNRKQALSDDIKANKIRVCFGSKALFKQQYQLAKNGYINHKDWLADWQASRQNQFFSLGSSDETSGNQSCTLFEADGGYQLRLLLPQAMRQDGEKYLWLDNLNFPYLPEVIEQAVLSNRHRTEQKSLYAKQKKAGTLPLVDDKPQTEAQRLAGLGQALSYRFIKDRKGWRILVSTQLSKPLPEKDLSRGALGIDFNQGFVSLAHVNPRGQKVQLMDIPYADEVQATSPQNKTRMQAVAKQIVEYAQAERLPIAIENLSFNNKKAALQKRDNKGYNRMLSQLSYALFKQAISMQCFKRGIALIEVNPAYTSLIGRLKYARETNFNTHQAAAWVIARRALGLKERVPKQSMIKLPNRAFAVFTAPEDAAKNTKPMLMIGQAFNRWLTETIKAYRLQAQQLRQLVRLPEDPFPDF